MTKSNKPKSEAPTGHAHRRARLEALSQLANAQPASHTEPIKPPAPARMSLEDALAEMEAKNTEFAAFKAIHAPELAAQIAKGDELNARLAALPQKQRRQVLDAMGLHNVSAVPPPIESLRNSGSYCLPRAQPALQPARWQVWRLVPNAELWQAVALSLDIEPDDSLTGEAMGRSKRSMLPGDFFDRLKVCQANLSYTGPIRSHLGMGLGWGDSPRLPVPVADVATFLMQSGFDVPEAMRTLAKPAAPVVTPEPDPKPPAGTVEAGTAVEVPNSGNSTLVFREMAGLNASELALAFVGDKPESGLGANNMLEVSARDQKRRIPLASLELVNRVTGAPNGQCAILLGLTQGSKIRNLSANTSKMKRLRRVFLNHFGIDKDPFEPYTHACGWMPLFTITDKRGAADERAKKEAEERMASLEQLAETGIQFSDRSNSGADDWMRERGHSF